jgi:crotonobetainyl-CoA:carnitine CoA-transferase CaiB-like acyl-CoA transferase
VASALGDVRVIDLATVIAGPGAARHLADFGAEVIKVESPRGDPCRHLGWSPGPADPDSYYWKLVNRGKELETVDLKTPVGRDRLLELAAGADVVVENMRPGKLEALGLGPDVLLEVNPRLVVLRMTAFGQDGPAAGRAGFATLAEAMSGWAAISGDPDGKPLLPPVALTDEVAALAGAFAVMVALWHARATGEGQVIDVNLLETMVQMLGPLPSAWAHLGYEQPRLSGGLPYTVPRGTYRCADGRYIAVSSSSDDVARRTLGVIGLGADDRFADAAGRAAHREELEAHMERWCAGRSSAEAMAALQAADSAVAPVYTMSELFADPHARAREIFVEVDGVVQPRPVARLSRTPGRVRWPGRARRPT